MSHAPEEDARKFAALRNRDSGSYIVGGALSMMADNIEHVLSYWVLWQIFHSPWLVAFQIVSHWLPYLLFSVYAGALAERYDCRRIIQIAQALFIAVSIAWGIMFLTGAVELWIACALLVIHGLAGALWMPAEQMMLYDFVGPKQLPGAVRINATFRSLAFVAGPVVGSALLLSIGPALGMFVNVLCYLPLTVFLALTKFTGHRRAAVAESQMLGGDQVTPTTGRMVASNRDGGMISENDAVSEADGAGVREINEPVATGGAADSERLTIRSAFRVLATVRTNRLLGGMMLLGALGSLAIGQVMQNAMPEFAEVLGAGSAGLAYGVLLFANGAGGVLGGFLLEATRRVPATGVTAVVSAVLVGVSTIVFAVSGSYVLAVIALVVSGLARITSESTEMSIVQLQAPDGERGRIIGAYNMFGPGMMTFNGVMVGVLGALFGIRGAVLVGGILLAVGAVLVGAYMFWPGRREQETRQAGTAG